MLLWPRLDRAKLRKVADDPVRLAGLIERRTSQPHDVIVAMLTGEADSLAARANGSADFDSGRSEPARLTLRVVPADSDTRVKVRDLPA
jgi:hypothetical protein